MSLARSRTQSKVTGYMKKQEKYNSYSKSKKQSLEAIPPSR